MLKSHQCLDEHATICKHAVARPASIPAQPSYFGSMTGDRTRGVLFGVVSLSFTVIVGIFGSLPSSTLSWCLAVLPCARHVLTAGMSALKRCSCVPYAFGVSFMRV